MELNNFELQNEIKRILKDQLNESGGIFNSSINSLKKGKYYLMGYNPGGEVEKHKKYTLENDIDSFFESGGENLWKQINSDGWSTNLKKNLQIFLKDYIGIDNPAEVFFTNLLFIRSNDSKSLDVENPRILAAHFWEIHKMFLNIIDPEVIIGIGYDNNKLSTYNFIKKHLKNLEELKVENSKLKVLSGKVLEKDRLFVFFHHFSWATPSRTISEKEFKAFLGSR